MHLSRAFQTRIDARLLLQSIPGIRVEHARFLRGTDESHLALQETSQLPSRIQSGSSLEVLLLREWMRRAAPFVRVYTPGNKTHCRPSMCAPYGIALPIHRHPEKNGDEF